MRRSRLLRRSAVIAAVLAVPVVHLPILHASQPGGPNSLTTAGDIHSVTLSVLERVDCCPQTMKLELEAQDKKTGLQRAIVWTLRASSITGLSLAGEGQALVSCTLPRGGHVLTLVDMEAGSARGGVWTYRYAQSPSGRYLVYQSWHPPHGLPAAAKSILLVMDLADPHAFETEAPSADSLSCSPLFGRPVFPEANLQKRSKDRYLEGRHGYISPFLWSDDETKIVFVVYRDSDAMNYLVTVDLSLGLESPVLRRAPLRIEDLAKRGAAIDEVKRRFAERPFHCMVREIGWSAPDEVVLIPYHFHWLPDEIRLMVP